MMNGDKENPREVSEGNIQLAEKESNGEHLPQSSTIKENGDPDDEAEEQLVGKTKKEAPEVKFSSTDAQNGDAKIDVEKIAFVGMGKEELMKFANDPFWVRLRWFLFILFWLLWAAMLAGAIAIIVMAPKCSAPPPLKWYEQGPLYQIFLPAFKDGSTPQNGIGDLEGLESKVNYIKDLGVKGIALSGVLKSADDKEDSVEDFKLISSTYGTLEQFKNFTTALKDKGIQLLLSFVPNHTSNKHVWFNKSEHNDSQYMDYYMWSPGRPPYDSEGKLQPPNNWISVTGGPAWTWSDIRKSYYLHQFNPDQPDLNFNNSKVVDEFKSVFEFWLDHGVSGFQLDKVEYLLEDSELRNETEVGTTGTVFDERGYLSHLKTTNQPGIIGVLAKWRGFIQNYRSDAILSVAGELLSNMFVESDKNPKVVDLLQSNTIFSHLKRGFTADDLDRLVQQYLDNINTTRPVWQLSSFNASRIATQLSPDYVEGLHMVTMLLPGTPITLYGDELGMESAAGSQQPPAMSWSNDTNAGFTNSSKSAYPISNNYKDANVEAEPSDSHSNLHLYKTLVTYRNDEAIKYGEAEYRVLNNGTVFAFTRNWVKSGHPGYLIMLNTAKMNITVNLTEFKQVPNDLTLKIGSSNTSFKERNIQKDEVTLPPAGALVVTFVPIHED